MCKCEDCVWFKEDFEYDDYTDATFDYYKCVLRDEILDTPDREACVDYEA